MPSSEQKAPRGIIIRLQPSEMRAYSTISRLLTEKGLDLEQANRTILLNGLTHEKARARPLLLILRLLSDLKRRGVSSRLLKKSLVKAMCLTDL